MKKALALFVGMIIIILSISSCAAAKSEEVTETEALIQTALDNAENLSKAKKKMQKDNAEYEDWNKYKEADKVFYDSAKDAKEAYNELTPEEKDKVENYDLLKEKEMEFYGDFLANYETADELIDMLIDKYYYESRESITYGKLQTLKNNTDLHHFFQEDEKENHIARKLYEGIDAPGFSYNDKKSLSGSQIFELYKACNNTVWFWGLNYSGGTPLVFCVAGKDAKEYGVPLSLEAIADDIKDDFKDPHSVSVEEVMMYAPEIDENETVFPSPLKIMMKAKVRATNSFGAYVTQNFAIEFKYPNSKVLNEIDDTAYSSSFYTFKGYKSSYWPIKN